jgi:hypothetical protein
MYGTTAMTAPLVARLHGPAEIEAWFADLFVRFPNLQLILTDVVVGGWPWNTTGAVRLNIAATLADGSAYRNRAIQRLRVRWAAWFSTRCWKMPRPSTAPAAFKLPPSTETRVLCQNPGR